MSHRRYVLELLSKRRSQQLCVLSHTQLNSNHRMLCNRNYAILSPSQVSTVLRMNEATLDGRIRNKFPVRAFDSNQLASNNPIEDRRAVARITNNPSTGLFGVFDGHGGPACAQAVSERLFDYIAVSMLSVNELEQFNHDLKDGTAKALLRPYSFRNHYYADGLSNIYKQSLQKFVVETLSTSGVDEEEIAVSRRISRAIRQLDNDISAEALPVMGKLNNDALEIALSGAVSTVVYMEGLNVHIANIGDTRAVLGQQTSDGAWVAKPLTVDHTHENKCEVERILKQHPVSEHGHILKHDRLLGQLYPLRAFGDMRYKWNRSDLKKVESISGNRYSQIIPPQYYTPPYLTVKPEMFHYTLSPRDRFIVLASDGLWECLTNEEVITLVGDHMESISSPATFDIDVTMNLDAINRALKNRKSGLAYKLQDANGATHLIRHALGPAHADISKMLTLPPDIVRNYRDDITVIIIYLDEQFLESYAQV